MHSKFRNYKINFKKIRKKINGRFSLGFFLIELNNNQSETKAKINSQIKLLSLKIT